MNNCSLENNYVIVCKYYAFEHLSCDIFGDVIFYRFQEKYLMWHHSIPFDVTARFSKKDRECSEYIRTGPDWFMRWLDYFWVSYDKQVRKNDFRIAIKKICLRQQKMNE